jgi:hypothetical protein
LFAVSVVLLRVTLADTVKRYVLPGVMVCVSEKRKVLLVEFCVQVRTVVRLPFALTRARVIVASMLVTPVAAFMFTIPVAVLPEDEIATVMLLT